MNIRRPEWLATSWRPRIAFGVALVFAVSPEQLRAADEPIVRPDTSYAVLTWSMEDGLPLDKVRALAQTPDGYLWVGTFNGLARFDGVTFTVFDISNTPTLHNNGIESLCTDETGALYIGDNRGGLTRLADGQFEAIALPDAWSAKPVLRLVRASDGVVWAMNEEGWLLALQDGIAGKLIKLRTSPNLLTIDSRGQAWVAIRGQLHRLDPITGVTPLTDGPHLDGRCEAIFTARAGGIWILCDGWLRRWSDGRWVEDRGRSDWGTIVLASFLESRAGQIFGGSFKEGVTVLNPDGSKERIDESNGLVNNWAYCLFEDREENIWVGTGNGGLHSLYRRRVTMVDPPDHWRSSAVLSVAPALSGGLWIGTEGGGVYRMKDEVISRLHGSQNIWQSVANSVLEDRQGRLWVGTWNTGLGLIENGEFNAAWPTKNGREVVLTVFESHNGDIWAGTRAGPGRMRSGAWEWFEDVPELNQAVARCFAEQQDGTIWCGLDGGGVCRIDADGIRVLRKSDGLVDNYVRTLFVDQNDVVWIGTRSGLSRYQAGRFSSITSRNGLPNDVICQILDSGDGYLWMGSFGGLFRVAKAELELCAAGERSWVNCLVCDRSSGLATLEMSEQGQPAGCRTSDGRLWFATGRGLAMVQPSEVRENTLPPTVIIEDVLLDGLPMPSHHISDPKTLRLGPTSGQLEFRYTGVSLSNPARVGFRYRLVGLESEWIEAGGRRTAFYPHLPPGKYSFQVIARNADGVWNPTAASLAVEMLPHYWQTWWFKTGVWLLTVGAVVLVVLIVVRRRAHQRLAASESQRALEEERGRIARDIHDDLGGSLTHIVMLSESAREGLDDQEQSNIHLGAISHTARELTLKMSEIVWAVNPDHDTLDSLANFIGKFAHDILTGTGIRCRLDIPLSLPTQILATPRRHSLFLAFKESLHNVVKHSGATSVHVSLAMEDQQLRLSVQDDGRGFDTATAPRGGNGLNNMHHRLAAHGGRCEVKSAPGEGCRVQLVLPLTLQPQIISRS